MSKLLLVTGKRFLGVFFLVFCLQITFLLYIDYAIALRYPSIKYLREVNLYMHMVFLVVYSSAMYWLYASSKRIDKELGRVATLAGTSAYNPQRVERILGQFGQHLNQILTQTLQLSEKRRLKIGAQKVVQEMLQELVEPFFVLVDASGQVMGYSVAAKERLGSQLQERAYLGDILSGFEVRRYVAHFSTYAQMIPMGNYHCYPVYDEDAMIQYVFVMDGTHQMSARSERSFENVSHKVAHRKSFLSRINQSL
jgi:hypothetical protein